MNYNVTDIVFDFDDDEANTVCNSDLETFLLLPSLLEEK